MTVDSLDDSAVGTTDLWSLTAGVVRREARFAASSLRVPTTGPGADAAAEVLGVRLPGRPNTWVTSGTGRVVWLGPDEWLVTEPAASSADGAALEDRLRASVVPHGGTAVDVSAQRVALRLSGPSARAVLAKGCSLDVHPRSFGPGTCAQTTLGQAGVVLLSLGSTSEEFTVLVRSSFANYLTDWLIDATFEFRS